LGVGCGDPAAPAGSAPSASAASSVVAAAAPAGSGGADAAADDETSTRPVELLKLVFTKEVKDKEPVGQLQVASPGQKVFAHLTLRNRSGRPRKVQLAFSVGGEKRTTVELFVGDSWSWRTWAYNTTLPRDAGKKLDLEITDDQGHPLFEGAIPIR
jgi:hypothetical protein